MSPKKRIGFVSFILLITVFLDQGTKKLATQMLMGHPPIPYWNNFFRFDYVENPGAFLSLGGTLSPSVRFWVLNIAVSVFLLVLLYSVITSKTMTFFNTLCLSLVLGGGISNLIDRFFRHNGQVVDFMNMGIGSLRTGVFNVADVFIMFGIIAYALTTLAAPQAESDSVGPDESKA
ncbi:MAG: signal peptidase II [Bdellovibrionia bacterium]